MTELQTYNHLAEGGRVKSAGLSFSDIYSIASPYIALRTPSAAAETSDTFARLRKNPPRALRDRFFPLSRPEVKTLVGGNSPALYRPILKTDQGQGKFAPFFIGSEEGPISAMLTTEQGHIIPEGFFENHLSNPMIAEEYNLLTQAYREDRLDEARMHLQNITVFCDLNGIQFSREAGVGRQGFFYIHSATAEKPIVMSRSKALEAEQKVAGKFTELVDKANFKMKQFAHENNLPERPIDESSIPVYYQADVHMFKKSDPLVAEIQIPDVGMFLNGINPDGNLALQQIQEIIPPITESILDKMALRAFDELKSNNSTNIFLVTRPDVIEKQEDTLEIRELNVVVGGLRERGINVNIISDEIAAHVDSSSLFFLFNLDTNSEGFNILAKAFLQDEERILNMVPHPFMRAVEKSVTSYPEVELKATELDALHAIVGQRENDPSRIYTQMMAAEHFLHLKGVKHPNLHICHRTLPTPIAAYTHDIHSLHTASAVLKRHGLSEGVTIRSIDLDEHDSLVFDTDGKPLYATFRFMYS